LYNYTNEDLDIPSPITNKKASVIKTEVEDQEIQKIEEIKTAIRKLADDQK